MSSPILKDLQKDFATLVQALQGTALRLPEIPLSELVTANFQFDKQIDGIRKGLRHCYTTTPDGRRIFEPELWAIEKLARNNGQVIDKILNSLKLVEGHVSEVGFHTLGIMDFEHISLLTNLTKLIIVKNRILDLTPLSKLTKLTELGLWNNKVRDITPLSGLTDLQVLYLENNQISDLESLSGLNNLTKLRLAGNRIIDIGSLSRLNNLASVKLSRNQISDIDPLSKLPALARVELGDNPLSESSRQIVKMLKKRGVSLDV